MSAGAGPSFPGSPPAGIPSVSVQALLAQHGDDPLAALSSLVATHNALLQHCHGLQRQREAAEKAAERSAAENQQLWRSLKAKGATGGSPRPSTGSRQNSEVGKEGPRERLNPGGGSTTTASSSTVPLRRGFSSDAPLASNKLDPLHPRLPNSPSHDELASSALPIFAHASPPAIRNKSATPPPIPSVDPTRDGGPFALRKAASLDLTRAGQTADYDSDAEYPAGMIPASPVATQGDERHLSTSRLPFSTSMPSISSHDRGIVDPSPESSSSNGGSPRRYLPTIVPVSPLLVHHAMDHPDSPHESSSSGPKSAQDLQLQPPVASGRTRSVSSNSTSSLGSGVTDESRRLAPAHEISPLSEQPITAEPLRSPTTPHQSSLPFPPPPPGHSPYTRTSASPSSSTIHAREDSAASTSSSRKTNPQQSQHPQQSQPPPQPQPHTPPQQPQYQPPPPPRPTLSPAFLPFTRVRVGSSNLKIGEKGKEIVSFIVDVMVTVPPESDPARQGGSASWKLEKAYAEIQQLDSAVRSKVSRSEGKVIASLPDKSLFKDHAPHKSDQRKAILERYLQTLLTIPLRDRTAVCNFFNTDVMMDGVGPQPASGTMSGWLTKRGRNFGGWQTRYYVLANGTLSYYDTQNGSKLGEIPLQNAAIGRQSSRAADAGEDSYLHAFLIRTTSRKDDKDQDADHILCAENDDARDAWVISLTSLQGSKVAGRPHGTSMDTDRGVTSPDSHAHRIHHREQSTGSTATAASSVDARSHSHMKRAPSGDIITPSASLPSNLGGAVVTNGSDPMKRAASELGQYADPPYPQEAPVRERQPAKLQPPPTRRDGDRQHKTSMDRPPSPEKQRSSESSHRITASNVSGPMNAAPMPSGYDFKKAERSKKTKSSFWGFAQRGSSNTPSNDRSMVNHGPPAPTHPVFGVPLKEAVAVSRIRPGLELPAVVYRCVEYLEAKNAESEEGIFRLSGSSNVVKLLKDRFNAEGDVNLLASAEYWDVHAISGLLKTFLRELPNHLLTRELHNDFLSILDLQDRKDRVNALGTVVMRLPIEEYTLFRFFFAHLCVIAQNSETSKMNVRNLGIVFSPTLQIPAPLFSLLLVEFDHVFAVEQETGRSQPIMVEEDVQAPNGTRPAVKHRVRPNSELYEATGADRLMERDSSRQLLREQLDEESDAESSTEYPDEDMEDETATRHFSNSAGTGAVGSPSLANIIAEGSPQSHHSPGTPNNLNVAFPKPRPSSPGLPASPRPGATFSNQAVPYSPQP